MSIALSMLKKPGLSKCTVEFENSTVFKESCTEQSLPMNHFPNLKDHPAFRHTAFQPLYRYRDH